MNSATKSKWQVRIAATIIFLLGFTAGILALNVYRGWPRGMGSHEDRFEQMARTLNLDPEQRTKVQQIFGDTRDQLRALRAESDAKVSNIRQQADQRMQQVLNQEQWQKFQTMRDEMRARRGRGGPPR